MAEMTQDEAFASLNSLAEILQQNPNASLSDLATDVENAGPAFRTLGLGEAHRRLVKGIQNGTPDAELREDVTQAIIAASQAEEDRLEAIKGSLDEDLGTAISALREKNALSPDRMARMNRLRHVVPSMVDQLHQGTRLGQEVTTLSRTGPTEAPEEMAEAHKLIASKLGDWTHASARTLQPFYDLYRNPQNVRRDIPAEEVEGVLNVDTETHMVCEQNGTYYVFNRNEGALGNDRGPTVVRPDGSELDAAGNPYRSDDGNTPDSPQFRNH